MRLLCSSLLDWVESREPPLIWRQDISALPQLHSSEHLMLSRLPWCANRGLSITDLAYVTLWAGGGLLLIDVIRCAGEEWSRET